MNTENGITKTTRKELYKMVWETPVLQLSKQLGISDVGLTKVCKRHDIPTPPRGYWMKKEGGLKPKKTRLPSPSKDTDIEFQSKSTALNEGNTELIDDVAAKLEYETTEQNRIVVPPNIKDIHPIAKRMRTELRESEKDRQGLHASKGFPEVTVAWKNIPRVTRLIDALFKALEQRGYLQEDDVVIFGEKVSFDIHEVLESKLTAFTKKRVKAGEPKPRYNWHDYDRIPTGRLEVDISIDSFWISDLQSRWKDGKYQRIENRLNKIIYGLIQRAARERERTLEKERQEEERRIEHEEINARQRKVAKKHARIDKLNSDFKQWKKSISMREYLDEVRNAYEFHEGNIDPDSPFGRWLVWADDYVDRHDPLMNGEAFRGKD